MTDTVVLLAISQVICLGAVAYLHARVGSLQRQLSGSRAPRPAPMAPMRGRLPEIAGVHPAPASDLAALAARMHDLGVDVPALARRMRRSEDEVRSLLRHNGVEA